MGSFLRQVKIHLANSVAMPAKSRRIQSSEPLRGACGRIAWKLSFTRARITCKECLAKLEGTK